MTNQEFNNLISETLQEGIEILAKKGVEYSEEYPDRLENFKRAAALQGVTPTAALYGMLAKHSVSLAMMAQNPRPEEYPIAQWKEKILDSINYLLLLLGTVQEEIDDEAKRVEV